MIVNKYFNGGGGSGSGSTGPQGPQGPQGFAGTDGVQGPQGVEGVQGPAGEGGSGSTAYKIELSTDTPDDFTEADIAALEAFCAAADADPSIEEGAYLFIDNEVYRNIFIDVQDLQGGKLQHYTFTNTDAGYTYSVEVSFDNGVYSTGSHHIWQSEYLYPSESFPADPEEGMIANYDDGNGNIGLYRYDGSDWVAFGGGEGSPIIGLDTISGVTGEVNTLYEYNGRLYKWVNGDGNWGKWVIADYSNLSGAGTINNQMNYLAYSYLPTDGKICALYYVNTYYSLALDRANNVLNYYDNRNATGTPVSSITFGSSAHTSGYYNRYIDITWEEGLITFNCGAFTKLYDMMSTTQSGGHFEALDVINFKGKNLNNSSAQGLNIPVWNSEGLIYGSAMWLDVGSKKLNTTGYGNTVDFIVKNGAGGTKYQSWYIPTQGGTVGQVLTSAGDAEPQWATLIKSVKITSQAYEALQTKDPNTLYLIVDE